MPKRPLTNKDGEVRPLTPRISGMSSRSKIQEVDPGMIEAAEQFRRRGRPATRVSRKDCATHWRRESYDGRTQQAGDCDQAPGLSPRARARGHPD